MGSLAPILVLEGVGVRAGRRCPCRGWQAQAALLWAGSKPARACDSRGGGQGRVPADVG